MLPFQKTKIIISGLTRALTKISILHRQSIYLTREEKNRSRHLGNEESFSINDLLHLSELNPPVNVMPNGNVGTPSAVFQSLIQKCVLPARLIFFMRALNAQGFQGTGL